MLRSNEIRVDLARRFDGVQPLCGADVRRPKGGRDANFRAMGAERIRQRRAAFLTKKCRGLHPPLLINFWFSR
jgi:hypothetical protein